MKKLIPIILLFFSVLAFAQTGDKAIKVDLLNTSSKAEIKQIVDQLKEKDIKLSVTKVKRNNGLISRVHLEMTTAKGVVKGNYTDFSKITIYQDKDGGFGITPVQAEGQK